MFPGAVGGLMGGPGRCPLGPYVLPLGYGGEGPRAPPPCSLFRSLCPLPPASHSRDHGVSVLHAAEGFLAFPGNCSAGGQGPGSPPLPSAPVLGRAHSE